MKLDPPNAFEEGSSTKAKVLRVRGAAAQVVVEDEEVRLRV